MNTKLRCVAGPFCTFLKTYVERVIYSYDNLDGGSKFIPLGRETLASFFLQLLIGLLCMILESMMYIIRRIPRLCPQRVEN
jgi:hypothetical protein